VTLVDEDLVTGSEVGRRLGVSRQRVYQWLANPRLKFPPPLRLSSRIVLWRWAEVAAWYGRREAGRSEPVRRA